MNPHTPPLFIGCATALVTPFRHGEVDRDAYLRLVRFQLKNRVDALVICGTTGEASTLTDAEREWLISVAVGESLASPHPIPIIAGAGSNNTRRAVEYARIAEDCGADGLLVVTPYYNKATEDGLVRHYEAITAAASLPVIAYHVPARTGCKLTPETCKRLSENPRIAGLKDATGDLSFTARVAALCGDSLPLYAGNDDQTLPVLSLGGQGVISVVSNLLPQRMSRLCRLWREGKAVEAAAEQLTLIPLCDALFCEVNPVPVKAGLSILGLCEDEMRLPLSAAGSGTRARVLEALKQLQ